MNLDEYASFSDIDTQGMLAEIDGLPDQLQMAWELGQRQPLPPGEGIRQVIIAGMGARIAVIGKSMAIPAVGPMPGSTPTRVPSMVPISANARFSREKALENPSNKRKKVSNFLLLASI